MSAKKKVLFFAPFGAWVVHHQLDAAMAVALQLRGCEVKVVGCDGLFLNCHITGNPPNAEYCQVCSTSGQKLFSAFHLPVTQLRSVLTPQDHEDARNWTRSLKVDDLSNAQFEGNPLSDWIASEMYSYFRTSKLDYSRKDVVLMNMSCLYNAAILQRALNKIYDDFQPDFIFSYHSVHLYYRVAYELARKRQIHVMAHERGWIDDSFLIVRDNTVYQYQTRFDACEGWKNIPLSLSELKEIRKFFQDRETGKNTNFMPMYTFSSNDEQVRRALRIPPDAKIVALMGSGDWEVGMFRNHGHMTYTSQIDWIKKTAEICAKNNTYLVIRHHPLVAGNSSYPSGKLFLKNLYALNRELPKNVRVIMPSEKVTSYSVLWNSDVGITLFSTIGGEAILRGVQSLALTDSLFKPMGMDIVWSEQEYEQKVNEALARSDTFHVESLRKAYRFAHALYFKLSHKFKSIGFKDTYSPDIRIRSLDELREGIDPMLDQVCNNILHDAPLYVLPEAGERSEQLETEFLQNEFDQVMKHRKDVAISAKKQFRSTEPKVSVIRVRSEGITPPTTSFLTKTLQVSRHQNIHLTDLRLGSESPLSYIEKLIDACVKTDGELIYVAPDNIHVDESVFSTSIDFLEKSEHQSVQATSWGTWVCDTSGTPQVQLFTEQGKVENFEAGIHAAKNLADPSQLLSLIVFRKAGFLKLCHELQEKAQSLSDIKSLSAELFRQLLSPSPLLNVKAMGIPMITIYPPWDLKEVLQQGIQSYQSGRVRDALMVFDQLHSMGIHSPELTQWRGLAKTRWDALVQEKLQPALS